MQFEMRLGYQVRVERSNPAGERLLVLLHGFGASCFSWQSVLPALSEFGEVLAYDRPGFGFTEHPKHWSGTSPYSLAGQVELLDDFLTTDAKGRPVILIGHSAGALVAAEYTLRHSDKVTALVLESPAILRGSPVPEALKPSLQTAPLAAIGSRLLSAFPKAGRKILRSAWFDQTKLTDEVVAGFEAPLLRPDWQFGLWQFSAADQRAEVRTRLSGLRIPTLVISGAHDRIVRLADTERVAAEISGSRLVVVPECGHIAHEEQPEQFLSSIKDFLPPLA